MPIITREMAKAASICEWERFDQSPAYDANRDALVYPDEISDALLAELATDRHRLMWLVLHRLIPCDYARARTMIRTVREREAAAKAARATAIDTTGWTEDDARRELEPWPVEPPEGPEQ